MARINVASLSVLIAISVIQGYSEAIRFTDEPIDTTATVGDKAVELKCSVDENAKISWFKNGKMIVEDYSHIIFFINKKGNKLKIGDVEKDDAGDYSCEATNDLGVKVQSRTVTITVQYICSNNFAIKPSRHVVFRDENVDLTCDCSGIPSPSYTWTKNRSSLSFTGKVLKVNSSGEYQCFANNPVKTLSSIPYVLSIKDGAPPRIVKPPIKQAIFVLKRPIMLNCVATGDPTPTVKWYYGSNNRPLRNTSVRHIFSNGSLYFNKVYARDSGNYKCSAENKYDTSNVYKSRLVQAFIGKIPPISEQFVALGISLSVTCQLPTAVPKILNIEWKLGSGAPLPNNTRFKVVGNKLQIDDSIKADSGIYQCIARNIAGEERLNVTVTVAIYPKVLQDPQNRIIIEGENTTLACNFSGDPEPKIIWEKDEMDLKPDNLKHYEINGSLLIIRMASPEVNGLYRCSAKLGKVTIRTKPAILKVREKITIKKSDHYKFEKGTIARLKCHVTGELPVISWSKVGSSTSMMSPHITSERNLLIIKNARLDDTGNYTCTAKNSFSHDSTVMIVNVYKSPVVIISPQNVTYKHNGSALFHCNMTGYPQPSILWYKNILGQVWQQLKNNNRVTIFKNGSLLLKPLQRSDLAGYTCFGGNAGGFKQITAYLQEKITESVDKGENSDNMAKTVGIAVGCAGAYIILVVGLMIYCKGRRARQAKNKLVLNGEEVPLNEAEEGNLQVIKTADTKLAFPRRDLEALRTLGSGSYGNVFLAKASEIVEGENSSIVVVQSLTSKEEEVKKEFMKTMEKLSQKHDNIAKLLGVCQEEEPMYLISEYPEQGDLKTVMRDSSSPLTPTQKVNISAEVAAGMNYLTNHHVIHKDLAARNCLVNKAFNVKIAFLSLNQGTYPKEYYKRNGEIIPLRWMSPEAMKGEFDETSDVWSFGILMWEVYTQGILPYEERSDEEVHKSVPYDLRLTKPESCPGKIFKMMEQCWEEESQERPTFGQLCGDFSEIPRESDF